MWPKSIKWKTSEVTRVKLHRVLNRVVVIRSCTIPLHPTQHKNHPFLLWYLAVYSLLPTPQSLSSLLYYQISCHSTAVVMFKFSKT